MTERETSGWRRHERDKFIKLITRLGSPYHLSHNNETNWSAFVVRGAMSRHITFEESGYTYVTRLYGNDPKEVEWLSGGFYAWIGELGIEDSEMAEALLGTL